MANTKTKTLSKTIVCRILRENYKDFWKDVFVVDDYCYFTNGKQMVRCLSSLLDLSNTDVRKMDIRNYDDKGKQTIKDMIKIFDTAIEDVKKAKYDDGCYAFDSRYRINRPLFKATVSATRKKVKEMDLGTAGKAAPISVLFRKTVVNAKYLLDLVELNKEKIVDVYVDDSKPLTPVVIGNESDGIVSILCPLREDFEPKRIDVTAIWEV